MSYKKGKSVIIPRRKLFLDILYLEYPERCFSYRIKIWIQSSRLINPATQTDYWYFIDWKGWWIQVFSYRQVAWLRSYSPDKTFDYSMTVRNDISLYETFTDCYKKLCILWRTLNTSIRMGHCIQVSDGALNKSIRWGFEYKY